MTMPEEAIAEAVDEFISGQSRFQTTLTGPSSSPGPFVY